MPRHRLAAVTDRKNRSIIRPDLEGPPFRGAAGHDYCCPQCGRVLVEGAKKDSFFDIAFECSCGTLSAFPPLPKKRSMSLDAIIVPVGIWRFASPVELSPKKTMIGADREGKTPPTVPFPYGSPNGGEVLPS